MNKENGSAEKGRRCAKGRWRSLWLALICLTLPHYTLFPAQCRKYGSVAAPAILCDFRNLPNA